ncbi:MAG: hypothetical protein ACU0B7_08810 [Paracoccaceae bacterium]|uniref:oxidoreductase n=1 Tax=Seohaeicola saemankumensis TaxID=481181 RepID=UPI001E372271|nr:oxidoreductase [Seohaeicola saemankumensis]MCD1625069.1 oxidoreductase [Seohaeicola saemankumensis]
MFRREFLGAIGSAGLLAALTGPAFAEDVLLSIDAQGDGSAIKTFTDTDLLALPQIEFSTSTIWTPEPATFSGPSLASVLEAAGAAKGALSMIAVNEYKVEIPTDRIEDNAPIIANRINGAPFSIRDKGPLWLVFPFDSNPRFQTEEVYSFSIWQLTQIKVVQG